jgi:hypothetical protein
VAGSNAIVEARCRLTRMLGFESGSEEEANGGAGGELGGSILGVKALVG